MRQKQKWECDFVGVLTSELEVDRKPIFVNKENSLQFLLRIISNEPDSFPRHIKTVTCFGDQLEDWGLDDDKTKNNYEREEHLKNFLESSLIIFQPVLQIGTGFQDFINAKDISLIAKKDSYTDSTRLIPVPIFQGENNDNIKDFESQLVNRKHIGLNNHISNEIDDTPELISYKTNDGDYYIYGEFDKHSYAHGGFRFEPKQKIKKLKIPESWIDDDIYNLDDVQFITLEFYEQLLKELNASGKELSSESDENKGFKNTENKSDENNLMTEDEWLGSLIDLAKQDGLNYKIEDLFNFHISMKTKRLVILSGLSGTGKSKLVNLYAKALGAQLNFISVRPSWTDDTDLIGYPDTLNNVYRPGDSGLINTIIKAANDPDNLYIICFDEMNLARVEHYFSQFLSVLEAEDKKVLRIYNDDLENKFYNSEQYKSTINIGDNLFFVGTVNIDESTFHFSDKVLDRSNVIELAIKPYKELLNIKRKKRVGTLEKNKDPRETRITPDMYNKGFINNDPEIQLSDDELELLWDMHITINKINSKLGIGPRVIKHIDQYLKNIPVSSPFSRYEALDLQIVQRVFTKLRGTEELMSKLVGIYNEENDNVKNSQLIKVFDESAIGYDFKFSKRVISEKAKEILINGFAL